MATINKHISDLLLFYIKMHYEEFLKQNEIDKIPDCDVSLCVQDILKQKKEHSRDYLKYALKELLKDEYPGDNQIDLLTRDMYQDDKVIISSISKEIINYQNTKHDKDKKD